MCLRGRPLNYANNESISAARLIVKGVVLEYGGLFSELRFDRDNYLECVYVYVYEERREKFVG